MNYYPSWIATRSLARLLRIVAFGLASAVLTFAKESALKRFDVPAGPVEKTFKQFTDQSGVQLIYATDQVKDIITNAVVGELEPKDALTKMLAGTPLLVVQDATPGAFAIRREKHRQNNNHPTPTQPSPDSAVDIAPSTVKKSSEMKKFHSSRALLGWLTAMLASISVTALHAQSNTYENNPGTSAELPNNAAEQQAVTLSPFEVAASSEEAGYLTKNTVSSSRIATDYLETAQTISVINQNYINDYNIQDARTLYESLPNVDALQGYALWVRGQAISTRYRDGILDITPYAPIGSLPMQFFDRVELVSGPSTAAFGIGEPGGIINYVSKTPTGKTDSTIEVGVGDWRNYETNVDTEGVFSKSAVGNVFYRLVGFYDSGQYEVQNESHRGAGGMLSLRDELNPTTRLELNVEYSRTNYPLSDTTFELYENQTAYSTLMALIGPGGTPAIPALPNSNPYPGAKAAENGNWAGGTLLPQGTSPLPDIGGDTVDEFRLAFVIDKSLLDNALTIRNTVMIESLREDWEYITQAAFGYIDPATGQPFQNAGYNAPYPNNDNGPLSDFGASLTALAEANSGNARSENLDIDYHKRLFGGDWRLSIGGVINEASTAQNEYQYNITTPNGQPLWLFAFQPNNEPINLHQNPTTPITAGTGFDWAYGGYGNLNASYFHNIVTLGLGDRRDAGESRSYNADQNTSFTTGLTHSSGAPRESITIKPLGWVSLYALRAEHDDPPQIYQQWNIFTPGSDLAGIEAKYNNFNNPVSYIPKGTLKEYGVKAEFLNGAIAFSADFFTMSTSGDITTSGGLTIPEPNGSEAVLVENFLSGSTSKGGEVEMSGRIGRGLNFIFAYGITRGQYAPFADGNPDWIDPATTLSLHLKYTFASYHGYVAYVLGGGQRWGQHWANQDPYIFYESSTYVWDGGVGVKWDHGRQSLEWEQNNLLNKIPYITSHTAYSAGAPEQMFVKYKIRM